MTFCISATLWLAFAPAPAPSATSQPSTSAPTSPASITAGFLYKTLAFEGTVYAYCVFVPPTYDPHQAWPAILFLHGSGERGSDGLLQTEVGIGTWLRRDYAHIPALVVLPQCPQNQVWVGQPARMALACLEQTAREYHLDAERLYLTGLSLGGQGTWEVATLAPDRFAALMPVCGFVAFQGNDAAAVQRVVARVKHLPIWVFHGDADNAVSVERSREMVTALKAAGADVRYTEYKGQGHNVWDATYRDRDVWKWLFAQRRKAK